MDLGRGLHNGEGHWMVLVEEVTALPDSLFDGWGMASHAHLVRRGRSHLLANGFQVLVLHQVLAEVDAAEAGAARV